MCHDNCSQYISETKMIMETMDFITEEAHTNCRAGESANV